MPLVKAYADDHVCPVCGKDFICYYKDLWVYKRNWNNKEWIYCSWGCMQKHRRATDEQQAKKPERRGRRKKDDQ